MADTDLSKLTDEQLAVYRDLLAQKKSAPPASTATVDAGPKGIGPRLSDWANNVSEDIRHGGTVTLPGRVLHAMGARGTETGQPKEVSEYMASPLLGPSRMVRGTGKLLGGNAGGGLVDLAAGALQGAQIPMSFMGEAPQNAGIPGTANRVLTKVREAIPDVERAGQRFQSVMGKAGGTPIQLGEPGDIALRAQELASHGTTMPKVLRDFLATSTKPGSAPMTYEAGRDFASNAGSLAARDSMGANRPMRRLVTQFSTAMDRSNGAAAQAAGVGEDYQRAMREYRQAMQLRAAREAVTEAAKSNVGKAVGSVGLGAGGAYLVKKAMQ